MIRVLQNCLKLALVLLVVLSVPEDALCAKGKEKPKAKPIDAQVTRASKSSQPHSSESSGTQSSASSVNVVAGSSSSAQASSVEQSSSKKASFGMLGSDQMGKLPTFVKSNSLTVHGDERTFTYDGNVEVRQGDMTLTANTMDGKYNEQNQIDQIVAHDNVVVVKGENIRASGERAVFDNAGQIVTLTENPELQQEGSVLTADTIKVFLRENKSTAEGNVRVKLVKKSDPQGGGSLPSELKPLRR